MEGCHIDDVIEAATARSEHCLQIEKGQPDLLGKVGFGRAIVVASHLTGHEQQVARRDCGGISVLFVEGMAVCGKYCFGFVTGFNQRRLTSLGQHTCRPISPIKPLLAATK